MTEAPSNSEVEIALEIALNAIERVELPGLVWGFIDASLTEVEVIDAIRSDFAEHDRGEDIDEVVANLEERQLVRFWFENGERRYRSRFAEFVRLAARSRQLFPDRPWRAAPTLVSDYRLSITPRIYPKRDITPANAKAHLASAGITFSKCQQDIWEAVFSGQKLTNLSQFQLDAAQRILSEESEQGTIITAGTGSGKTLAFYLPAILHISEHLHSKSHSTKILSIYPRNELLKDQLSEVLRLARLVGPALSNSQRRPLRLGALYSDVPNFPHETSIKYSGWSHRQGGYICPFLRCPSCGSEMVWEIAAIRARNEVLLCTQCDDKTDSSELALTRESIQKAPSDLLFTTTEMLNQRLSDTKMRHVFGVGVRHREKPQYILLDEVHTYLGTTGAQTALLLRRWRTLLAKPIHWVGLSATLEEAPQFFSDLVGVRTSSILEVTPRFEDTTEEGAEYQLLLRSDPTSQTATLSTSIQTLFLLSRMLDPEPGAPSSGFFGSRVFAFTDDLDVTNRLFDDLRDAEAYDWFGRPDQRRAPLAALRSSNLPDRDERAIQGQLWSQPEALRGKLENRLSIARTTSRDPGVTRGADVIVATASLEVGFNDPDVGAVLQHKAPRSNASFVQRKGRAGRQRGMRPITITVLSDYGRDRLAFQTYEHLFSPQIELQRLPIKNSYILRMQAACALFDWIADRASAHHIDGWSWNELSAPPAHLRRSDAQFREFAKKLIRELAQLDPTRMADLREFMKRALRIDDAEVDRVLWNSPRSLFLEAIPTLARRLFTDWKLAADPKKTDFMVQYHPLPDFLPRQLFGELNLPEVQISVPPARDGGEPQEERLRIRQALSEFSPGKVRRRFADERGGLAHWFPLDPERSAQVIQVNAYAERHEYLGTFSGDTGKGKVPLKTFRPWRMRIEKVSMRQISPTSTSRWVWQSDYEVLGQSLSLDLPTHNTWSRFIDRADLYLHRLSSAIAVRRFAHRGVATLNVRGEKRRIDYSMQDEDGNAAAVGFAYEADGLVFRLNLPSPQELSDKPLPNDLHHWLKTLQFREAVLSDSNLPATLNNFQREWLTQIILFASIERSESSNISITAALDVLAEKDDPAELSSAISAVAAMVILDEEETQETRIEQSLKECIELEGVYQRLFATAKSTFSESSPDWPAWLHRVLKSTIAEAILQACILSTPKNAGLEGLTNDLLDDEDSISVVIVESTIGGGGTIEALAEKFTNDPRSLCRALDAALALSDAENASKGMRQILGLLDTDEDLRRTLTALRLASTKSEREEARTRFAQLLGQNGVQYSQAIGVSFSTRFVRPGTSDETDELTRDLIDHWEALESKHGIGLPTRLAAVLPSLNDELRGRLRDKFGDANELSAAEQLLWPRDSELRQYGLQSYSPYRENWVSDAGFARALLGRDPADVVDIDSDRWWDDLEAILARKGIAEVTSASGEADLRRALVRVLDRPIIVKYLRLYPAIDGFREDGQGRPLVSVSLREKA